MYNKQRYGLLILVLLSVFIVFLEYSLQTDIEKEEETHDSLHQFPRESSQEPKKEREKSNFNYISQFPDKIALVIFCYNRPEKTLTSVLKVIDQKYSSNIHIFVSQDQNHPGVTEIIQSFETKFESKKFNFTHLQHLETLDYNIKKQLKSWEIPYTKLSKHYKDSLIKIFNHNFSGAIILEDDMKLSIDFFEYMEVMWKFVEMRDVMAVSAWNDHGIKNRVLDPKRVYRTDFFPGLGWMLSRDVWKELEKKWPSAFWDDWLRSDSIRKGREFIAPELCRTFNFGSKGGASGNQFGRYLEKIKLNEEFVEFGKMDLMFLESKNYERKFFKEFEAAREIKKIKSLERLGSSGFDYKVKMSSRKELNKLLDKLGLMKDSRKPFRQSYKGVFTTRVKDSLIYVDIREVLD
eukprot:maker-scaffold_8-snap-gene-0.30-mRNA-1 protein AED:0.02 eAED:0.02 QI:17/0.88/0.9/1/0.88/0.8/10/410/405